MVVRNGAEMLNPSIWDMRSEAVFMGAERDPKVVAYLMAFLTKEIMPESHTSKCKLC